jgi:hypothetical protein
MGIGEPATNARDPFERGMLIVPDSIAPNEGEIPVKQYNIATLHDFLGNAEGRLQVTNKRVIFRANGRSLLGRTTVHNEFAIDEIAGIEVKRDFSFRSVRLLTGLIMFIIFASLGSMLVASTVEEGRFTPEFSIIGIFLIRDEWQLEREWVAQQENAAGIIGAGGVILGLLFGIGGNAPFFLLSKKFGLKLVLLSFGWGSFFALYAATGSGFILLFTLLAAATTIFGLILRCIIPRLVISIKNKGAAATVDIRSSGSMGAAMMAVGLSDSGFAQVLPTAETEGAVRELGAIINDIQKLGDHGVKKWAV